MPANRNESTPEVQFVSVTLQGVCGLLNKYVRPAAKCFDAYTRVQRKFRLLSLSLSNHTQNKQGKTGLNKKREEEKKTEKMCVPCVFQSAFRTLFFKCLIFYLLVALLF